MGPFSTVQGTILASLLYLIYILDFPLLFHSNSHNSVEDAKCSKTTDITYIDDINNMIKKLDKIPKQTTMMENLNQSKDNMN